MIEGKGKNREVERRGRGRRSEGLVQASPTNAVKSDACGCSLLVRATAVDVWFVQCAEAPGHCLPGAVLRHHCITARFCSTAGPFPL